MNVTLNAFVVADPGKCIGCKVCEVVCAVAHSDVEARTVGALQTPIIPRLYLVRTADVTMPVQCRHCEDAPCANVCPVGAITETDDTILVDDARCVGCKTCMLACPFGAMDLVPVYRGGELVLQGALEVATEDGLAEKALVVACKCDLCASRADGPACVQACPEEALEKVSLRKEKKKRSADAALSLLDSVKKFIS